ncbi:hypothetical protein E3A20_21710, partial [Planctomyces bekefii]
WTMGKPPKRKSPLFLSKQGGDKIAAKLTRDRIAATLQGAKIILLEY